MTDDAPAPRRRGRPARTSADTGPDARTRILEAARTEFSERGYDKTSVRGIARAAGVDSALVHHYFGTKDEVFAAAIELSFEPALLVPAVLEGDTRDVGERLARAFIAIWENPATRAPSSPYSAPPSPTRPPRRSCGASYSGACWSAWPRG